MRERERGKGQARYRTSGSTTGGCAGGAATGDGAATGGAATRKPISGSGSPPDAGKRCCDALPPGVPPSPPSGPVSWASHGTPALERTTCATAKRRRAHINRIFHSAGVQTRATQFWKARGETVLADPGSPHGSQMRTRGCPRRASCLLPSMPAKRKSMVVIAHACASIMCTCACEGAGVPRQHA